MRKSLLRFIAVAGTIVMAALLSGCASLVDGLNQVAYELDQENQRQAAAAFYRTYYGPRPSSDTSAPGIK